MKKYEYRVTWRREDWGPNTSDQSRIYSTYDAAARMVDKLRSDGRPDLSPIVKLDIAHREVGSWQDGWNR